MIRVIHEPPNWRFETDDVAGLRERLGPDVLNAFCRCFVHADRLQSLIGFAFRSDADNGVGSVAFQRDLQTMVWFTVGTLRELALAIRDLRSALAKRNRFNSDAPEWITLRGVEQRWEDDPFYRNLRNLVAFHVDQEQTERGLDALCGRNGVVLVHGSSSKQRDTQLVIGLEALSMGWDISLDGLDRFMQAVGEDQGIGAAIQQAFMSACRDAGVEIR